MTAPSTTPSAATTAAQPSPDWLGDLDIWLLWQEPQADAGDALFGVGQNNCPDNLTAAQSEIYSCMYFKVGL